MSFSIKSNIAVDQLKRVVPSSGGCDQPALKNIPVKITEKLLPGESVIIIGQYAINDVDTQGDANTTHLDLTSNLTGYNFFVEFFRNDLYDKNLPQQKWRYREVSIASISNIGQELGNVSYNELYTNPVPGIWSQNITGKGGIYSNVYRVLIDYTVPNFVYLYFTCM